MPPGLLEPVAQEVVAPYALEYQLTYPGLGQSAALVQALPVGSVSGGAGCCAQSQSRYSRRAGGTAGVGTGGTRDRGANACAAHPVGEPGCARLGGT